jgi:phosphatidylserine decarboxylase
MTAAWANRVAVWPQYLLPQQWLTRAAWALSQSRKPWIRKPLIAGFRRAFKVNLAEAAEPDASAYDCFNAFFTRALNSQARSLADDSHRLISPCDGTISQLGRIEQGQLIQAKGMHYSAARLLGSEDWAERFSNGHFMTIYLAPYDYHRVHAPLSAAPVEEFRIPGRLFSVSARTSRGVPELFTRNERMAVILDSEYGPVALVMVAALMVAGIETVWGGPADRRPGPAPQYRALQTAPLARGQELGRFHWGSTVILLTPADFPPWSDALKPGMVVRLGQALTPAESPTMERAS